MNLSNRETQDLVNELKYFTGCYECYEYDKTLTLWTSGEVKESIKILAWELINRKRLDEVKVLLAQPKQLAHKWICNSSGYDYCN